MSSLSQRGQRLVGGSTLPPYLREHLARVVDEPDHEYPYVCLTVAENKLMWDLLDEKVNVRRGVPPESMDYFVKAGSERFRTAVADFGSEHVWGTTIGPDAIVAMAGAGTVIEAVASVTGDPGDGVLIPTPTYAAYWMDIESRTGMAAVSAPMEAAHDFRIDPTMLQRHFEAVASDLPARTGSSAARHAAMAASVWVRSTIPASEPSPLATNEAAAVPRCAHSASDLSSASPAMNPAV